MTPPPALRAPLGEAHLQRPGGVRACHGENRPPQPGCAPAAGRCSRLRKCDAHGGASLTAVRGLTIRPQTVRSERRREVRRSPGQPLCGCHGNRASPDPGGRRGGTTPTCSPRGLAASVCGPRGAAFPSTRSPGAHGRRLCLTGGETEAPRSRRRARGHATGAKDRPPRPGVA